LRDGVRRAIETVLEEELMAALGAETHARTPGRRGYRHGAVTRTLTTRAGTRMITVPRARLETADGGTEEFRSTVVPRYARRTREVDEALLGCYFGGVNSRRIRRALKPLFGDAHLSKSAVSRVVARVGDPTVPVVPAGNAARVATSRWEPTMSASGRTTQRAGPYRQ
jgi:transposase-like protein